MQQAGGVATGSVTGSATTRPTRSTALVGRPTPPPAPARPAEDAGELVGDATSPDWDDPAPVPTDIHVYDAFAPALGEAFGRAAAAGRVLYGFVNHELTTTYLGSTPACGCGTSSPPGHSAAPARPPT